MAEDPILIVTYLWDDPKFRFRSKFAYGPQHVVALYKQLKRFLHVPFYFTVVCDVAMLKKMENWIACYQYDITPMATKGIDPNLDKIDTYRIWDEYADMGRCWRRLKGFSAYEFGHLSRVLFIDIDTMILDDITPLITENRNHPFVIADDTACEKSKYNGSFILFTPTPTTHKMWSTFHKNPRACQKLMIQKGYMGSDQAWIRYYLDEVAHYPVKTLGLSDGFLSFRWHCKDMGIDPHEAEARIVNFHGPYMPDMPEIQARYRWTQAYSAYVGKLDKPRAAGEREKTGGSPDPMTEIKKSHLIAIYRNGGNDRNITDYMGTQPNQIHRYLNRYPWLQEAKDAALALRIKTFGPTEKKTKKLSYL